MIKVGDVISYLDMCQEEGVNLQRGMNFRLHGKQSIFLMSVRENAPYADRVEEEGTILIYEGHDVPKSNGVEKPKHFDQPMYNPSGSLTQNGLFFDAAEKYKNGKEKPEKVKVYEKIKPGIWTYNGTFKLVDAWLELGNGRKVFKFKLLLTEEDGEKESRSYRELDHNRLIPTHVKLKVWKRDNGQCVQCGSRENLHFDHILPFSKGGTSLSAKNIQLLCMKHNLLKKDKIQ